MEVASGGTTDPPVWLSVFGSIGDSVATPALPGLSESQVGGTSC